MYLRNIKQISQKYLISISVTQSTHSPTVGYGLGAPQCTEENETGCSYPSKLLIRSTHANHL